MDQNDAWSAHRRSPAPALHRKMLALLVEAPARVPAHEMVARVDAGGVRPALLPAVTMSVGLWVAIAEVARSLM